MFGHRSFLVLGGGAADILSLIKGGYEILNCNFSFEQGVDDKGKATTKVYGGSISITLPIVPPPSIIEWGLNSRKYQDGAIVVLDNENISLERILFKNAACTGLDIEYSQQGETYTLTKIEIEAEILIVGNGIDFDNEWV